jgi:hypothetical protein
MWKAVSSPGRAPDWKSYANVDFIRVL